MRDREETAVILEQQQLFMQSLDSRYARMRRHNVESRMRSIVARMKNEATGKAWSAWQAKCAQKKRAENQKHRALARFKNRLMAIAFQTWQSWCRVQIKQSLLAEKGYGTAFVELQDKLAAEERQRHFEVEEINKVMQKLHVVVMSLDSVRARERLHAIESNLRKMLGRMAHGTLSKAWQSWRRYIWQCRRKDNLLRKAASRMLHKTLVECFRRLKAAAKQNMDEKKLRQEHQQHQELLRLKALVEKQTSGIDALIQESVAEKYYLVEEMRRQTNIQRYVQKANFVFRNRLLALAFNTWKARHKHKFRVNNLMHKAASRFVSSYLARAFQPWAAMARQATRDKHEASVTSNFEELQALQRRLDDQSELNDALRRIFNPNGPVFQPGDALSL